MYEDEEEEYLNDIISLNYFPIKTEPIIIDLSSDEEDDKSRVFAPRSFYGNRSFVLPIKFFDISRNVEFLKKCRPLSIKVVDCDKHPSYYENILRPKKPPYEETYPELTRILKVENDPSKTIVANEPAIPVNEVIHNKISQVTESQESTEINEKALGSISSRKETDPVDKGASRNVVLNHVDYEKRHDVKSKDLSQVDFKRNKGLVGLVIAKKDSESKNNCDKIVPVGKKISPEKDSSKKSIKDSKTSKKLEKVVIKLNKEVSEVNDVLEKDRSAKDSIIEAKVIPKNVDANETTESEYSPTRCSIKITCPKVFEKVIKLKNNFKKNPSEAKTETMMDPPTEKVIIKDHAIPKLNLKRKKSDIKEFYIINPANEKSHSEHKTTKNSDETHKKQTVINETVHQPTKPESEITYFIKETIVQPKMVSNKSSSKGPDGSQKTVFKMNRNESNPRDATPKINQTKVSLECSRALLNCQTESICNVQKSDKIKPKNKLHTLNPGSKCIENINNVSGSKNDFMAQNGTSSENECPNQGKNFQNVQNTSQVNLQNVLKNIKKKIQNKPRSPMSRWVYLYGQVKPNGKVLKSTISQPKSQPNVVSQLEKKKSLYNTYNSVNYVPTNDTSNDLALSSHLKAHKNISVSQSSSGNESQLPNQCTVSARDLNFVFMKRTPPLNYKETANAVIGPQENHKIGIQPPLPKSPHGPNVSTNECPSFVTPIYSKPPMHKAIILKSTPVRLPPNLHQNYGNPIPTLVNHNVYHPRPLAPSPSRFMSPWPPPSTNVVPNVSPVNMNTNGAPNCRMAYVNTNTNMPGYAMYSEFWRPPINENYRNYYMCPPPPPPPPPTAPVPKNINTGLPVEPPASTGTVIGSNAEGQLIKKITISAVPPCRSPVVNDKDKMLAELNNAVEEIDAASDTLEELRNKTLDDSEHVKMNSVPNAKPKCAKPCPLSKKKYQLQHTNVEERAKLTVAPEPIKGYSPPILPIPSYQQAFEILAKNEQKMADILKKMESINANKEVNIQTAKKITEKDNKNKQVDIKSIKKKSEKNIKNKKADCKTLKRKSPVPEKKKDEKMKKISLDEYKRKLANNDVSISAGSKRKKLKNLKGLAVDNSQDLGYDSDATLVL